MPGMGVHLEEPSSPLPQQWSASDLDEFVRQLTNPKHHISKLPTQTTTPHSSSQQYSHELTKCSFDLARDMKEKCSIHSCISLGEHSKDSEGSPEHHTKRKNRVLKSKQSKEESVEIDEAVEVSFGSTGDDGICDVSESFTIRSSEQHEELHVTFTCDSTPDGSDTEPCTSKSHHEISTCKKDSKKRRFRKMLTRPLRRSHSAGCAKDIPAHALFLQHQLGDKDVESMETRRAKLSSCDSTETEEMHRPARRIHKTSSADSAMLAAENIPSFTFQAKPKRSIAKNMKRKLQFLRRRHTDTALGATLKGENGKIGHINSEELHQWSRSFESLLTDKNGLELFKDFLISEFSEENIEFWIACEQFKTTKTNKLSTAAQKIYSDFVAIQAPKEINLDSKTRVVTLGNLTNPTRQSFEQAQKRVQALMEKDSYPRFLQSEVYQRLLSNQKS